MALIHRISRLFTADLHAVLDRLEEPEALLRQAVRDMEELLCQERAARAAARARTMRARRAAAMRSARRSRESMQELDLCLEPRRRRARPFVGAAQARRRTRDAAIDDAREEVVRQLTETRTLLDEQRRELDAVRQKAELFVPPARDARRRSAAEHAVSNDDVEIALLRERERRQPS